MFSPTIHYAWVITQAIISVSLLMPAALYFIYLIKKAVKKYQPESEELAEEKDYAIIVSVNGDNQDVQPLLNSLLQMNYTNYLIYVVMNNSRNANFRCYSDRVIVLNPAKRFTDAARIHRYAIENFKRSHTHLAILDGSSLADAEYLNEMNVYFNQGYQAVQSQILKKNHKTLADIIHSTGNLFNRFFRGDVSFILGSSATLANNGTAFTISVYKRCLLSANAKGMSLAKALQYVIVNKGYTIAFAPKAILYNERTMHLPQLIKQHAGGMNTWFRQLFTNFSLCIEGINSLNGNRFLFGLLLLQPPLFAGFLSGVFCLSITAWINPAAAIFWCVCLAIFLSCFLIAPAYIQTNQKLRKLIFRIKNNGSYVTPTLYEGAQDESYTIAT